MIKRPQIGETDEDILRLQKEFLASKTKCAANLVKDDEEEETDDFPPVNPREHIANTFEAIPMNAHIGTVIEKHDSSKLPTNFNMTKNGFPKAKRRDPSVSVNKGSIFAQQMKKLKTDGGNLVFENKVKPSTSNICQNEPKQSYVLSGKEKDIIHQENINILRKMSEEDIIKERNKLLEDMDPAIIAYLKDRRKNEQDRFCSKLVSIAEQNKYRDMKVEEINTPNEILTQPEAEKWLNFDVVETNKLAWMKDVQMSEVKKNSQFEARFDFEGWLLPYMEAEINEANRILYHHGDEPERPGYTLQELFQLSRSTILQQKVMALNAVSNILSLESTGVYQEVIDLPIEQIFFVLRFCLDDNTPSVLNSSIKAMRNLFFNYIDEICLDNLEGFGLGIVQPILAVDTKETEDDETINDQQIAETNLVKCLARTDILIRIRYVLNTVQPSQETIIYCLEILIRLARDSDFIVTRMYKCDNLVASIIKNFASPILDHDTQMTHGRPLVQAIKVLRLLCCRNKKIACELVNKYKIMDSVATYLSNDFISTNSNGLKLQIEAMIFWSTLLNCDLASEYFTILQPVLLRILHFHICNTNADNTSTLVMQAHASAFLNLLSNIGKTKFNCIEPYLDMVINIALPKWSSQLCGIQDVTCGKLQIISSLLYCISQFYKNKPSDYFLPSDKIEERVTNLLNSRGFQNITNDIRIGSNILSGFETFKSSANLLCIEAATWNSAEHIVPFLKTHSCMPFLCQLAEFVHSCYSVKLKLDFVKHQNIQIYLSHLSTCEKYSMTTNWFTRLESKFIMNILKISVQVRQDVDLNLFYQVAIKCMNIFNSEQKGDIEFILQNIIFNPSFYPTESLFGNLTLDNKETKNLTDLIFNLKDVLNVYINVLNLQKVLQPELCVDVKIGNIIPIDWIYSPIIVLYSDHQNNKSQLTEEQQMYIIINCLRWVYIYEMYFPILAAMINPTDRFCRLACIFLCSDSLFLNDETQILLSLCLKQLMIYQKNINFDKEIQGLSSFQDFYTQLLEQYQGVSYGNVLFGNFILFPLAQCHNVKWRKIVWSEYAGVIQTFNVTNEQSIVPFDAFIKPIENDASLIKCYGNILHSKLIKKQSILYDIANYHFLVNLKNKN